MDPDATLPLIRKNEETPGDVFSFGEQTILRMQEQAFTLDDYGTRVGAAAPAEPEAAAPVATAPAPVDPLVSIEQKLDIALRMLDQLQRRVDSLDAMIARLMTR